MTDAKRNAEVSGPWITAKEAHTAMIEALVQLALGAVEHRRREAARSDIVDLKHLNIPLPSIAKKLGVSRGRVVRTLQAARRRGSW